jgi:hypothetical protein
MLYFFENFVFDPARRELRRGNALIAVQPQVFDLLECPSSNGLGQSAVCGVWNGGSGSFWV